MCCILTTILELVFDESYLILFSLIRVITRSVRIYFLGNGIDFVTIF